MLRMTVRGSARATATSFASTGLANAKSENAKNAKKRVQFEDAAPTAEKEQALQAQANGAEEREFMDKVRREVALPEYTLFADYIEMVTQFGYVALWSTIWPLAPGESIFSFTEV